MQGEHYYVLTSLLIVYAGQHAAFKDEIGPSRAHLDARADSRKGAITLRRRRRSPSGSPRGLRVAIVSFSFCLLNLFCLKVPLPLSPEIRQEVDTLARCAGQAGADGLAVTSNAS